MSHLWKFLHGIATMVELIRLEEVKVEQEPLIRHALTHILKHGTKRLHNKKIGLVKVQWGDDLVEST